MVKCQNKECKNRNELEEDALFCEECGTQVNSETPEELDVPVLCPNLSKDGNRCLNPLQSGKKFCKKCGWKIDVIIFQPGSHICEKKTQNGDICLGIVGGERKVCTFCGAGVDCTKDIESTGTAGVEICNQQDTNTTHETQELDGKELITRQPDSKELIKEGPDGKELTRQPDDKELITKKPDGKELTRQPDGKELITKKPDGKELSRQPDGKELITKKPDGKELTRQPDGKELTRQPDGKELITKKPDGKELTRQPDGKELITEAQDGKDLITRGPDDKVLIRKGLDGKELIMQVSDDNHPFDATTCLTMQGRGILETIAGAKPVVGLRHEVTAEVSHVQIQNNEALEQSKLVGEGSEQCKMEIKEYQQAESHDKWEFQDRTAVQTETIETQQNPPTVFGFPDKAAKHSMSAIQKSNGEPDNLMSMGKALQNDPLFTVSKKSEVDTGRSNVNDKQMDVSEKSTNKNSQTLAPDEKTELTEANEPDKGSSQSSQSEDSESDGTEGEDVSQTTEKDSTKPGNKRKKQSTSKKRREKKKKKKQNREARKTEGDRNTGGEASSDTSNRPKTRSQRNTEQEGNADSQNQNVSGPLAASKTRSATTTTPESKGVEQFHYTKKNEIEVIFHGILSPSLLENVQKVTISYTMGKSPIKKCVESERVRSHEDGYMEYVTRICLPRHVAEKKEFYYAYHVTTVKKDSRSEYLYDVSGINTDRYISISDVKLKQEVYHQFDGVVDTKPHTWYNRVPYFGTKGKTKTVRNNAEKAVSIFFVEALKNLEKGNTTAEEFLERVEEIKTGLWGVYLIRAQLWNNFQDYEHFIGMNIKPLLEEMIDRNSCHEGGAAYTVAVAIVHLYTMINRYIGDNIEMLFHQTKMPLLRKEAICEQMEDFRRQFPNKLKDVTKSLQNFVNHFASKTTSAYWLFSVPLLHFMWGKCKPYERPSDKIGHDDKQPEWWGVVEFEHSQDHFKWKNGWNMSLHDIIEALAPMFAMDYFLPRTLMTVVKFQDCEEAILSHRFPVDVCLASLYYHYASSRKLGSDFEIIQRCLKELTKQMKTEGTSVDCLNEESLSDFYRIYVIAYDLQLKVLDYYYPNEITVCRVAVIVVQAIALFDNLLKDLDKISSKEKKPVFKRRHDGIYRDCKRKLMDLLEKSFNMYPQSVCQHSLKLWDILLSIDLPDGKICSDFTDDFKKKLESMINKKVEYHSDVLIDVYCDSLDMYSSHVQDVLSKMAMKAMMEGTSSKVAYQRNKGGRYGRLLSQVFEKQWTTLTDEGLFNKALKWSPFQHFLQMFYQKEESKMLSEKCGIQFTKAASILLQKMEMLKSGSLCIRDLDLITHNFDIFKKLLTTMMKKEDTSYFDSLLSLRKKELGAFREALVHVKGFLDLCNFIQVETTDIQGVLEDLVILDGKSIDSLCHPRILSDMKHPEEYNPKVTAFNLEEETLQLLPKLLRNKESSVFLKKWTDIGNQVARQKRDKLTIEETLDQVWIPVENWWIDLCLKLENGSMLFKEFERKLKNFDEQELEVEFTLMSQGRGTQWIKERLNQIRQYRELQGCVAGARAILNVVDCFELKGDFDAVKQITDVAEGSDMTMREMDESMMKTCELLRGFRDERTKCLDEFVSCKPLILWLKESMPSGLKELKVFVDLASISAGEGDMEIAKVQCLHAATTGYAPLIFNLTDDINYKEFLEKCETVWKELQADPKLPKKLHDTNRQLQWLKTVKKAHGSVEVTSLTQAEAINSVGIYKIGKLQDFKENKPTLDDVISLHVSEDDQGTRLRKKYHYGQLHDLQSRLMLVAGKAEKGKDDVDRFTMILDSVVRLGNVYTKLLSAGCVLFSNWKAKLLCERARRACCFITFGDGENAHTLKGRKENAQDEVSSMVPRIAKFMENCLRDWLKYIDEKRDKYYHLNYFTIDQMVILQKELVKIGTQDKPSNLIFPLLSAIKKDCRVEDIVEAMKEAQKEVEKIDKENEEIMETSDDEEDKKLDENEEKEFFIKELIQAGYTESLATKALQHFKTDQVDEAVVWCMDEDDEMEVEANGYMMSALNARDGEMETQTEQFQGWTSNQKSISSITAEILGHLPLVNTEVSVDPLIKGLESLWKTFLSSISSSVSDYLSVEHLGLILKRLAVRESFIVKREFLQCFKSGIPNLIIGPQADLLNTMLTIYMLNYRQPLPQPDEVLICSSHTTLDQLDTFWRRAVFATSERIYCLVNGDLLDYDVSDKGDQCLENHMEKAKELGIEYRLVVLCSAENEYKSRIVAALDRFRRPNLPVANLQSIRQYMQDQLRADNIPDKVIPAARVDFDQSTVRVVKSWRAGVGKTLYKKRMESELKRLYSSVGRTSEAVVSIPLHEREIDVDSIMSRLLECTLQPGRIEPRIFHIDVSHVVYVGVDALLFHLLILGCLSNSAGYVWRKSPHDHYIIETMPQLSLDTHSGNKRGELLYIHRCFEILPDMVCRSPEESLNIMRDVKKPPDYNVNDRLFDHQEFIGTVFQRPYQYLKHLDENKTLNDIDPYRPQGDEINCLQVLLRHCGMRDPSWAELKHFVWFLNTQLQDFEVSAFCSLAAMEDLPGFATFVLKFLIQMSRDFATRSLNMSEESPVQKLQFLALQDEEEMENTEGEFLQQFTMRRTWESSPHPYIFFNPDHNSMTFLGFNIDRATGNLLDHQTGIVLEKAIMARNLQDSLVRNRVNINENFDVLPRGDKIQKLCSVMGMDMPYDPDETYELTTDNVKKILAIYMRFKCDIPVIIMGETGCGKTRLVKFMCSLQCPPGVDVQNMILMKVHGGTKSSDIVRKVREAEKIAKRNSDIYGPHLQTVLFFDEANTTEAIGLIKEIMCDKTLRGKPLDLCKSLKIIAACNPYRKHSDELIKRLEQAGLGYHVDSELTVDRLGRIPMRRLVYRVQPLPQSLLPLVWDFGQLDTNVEELYIRQMVLRYINNGKLPGIGNLENVVSHILTVSQDFMRDQKDECSFVSLRDVERVLEVMSWFYAQASEDSCLFDLKEYEEEMDTSDEEDMTEEDSIDDQTQDLSDITRSLILALGVCYHACLKKRGEYRQTVAGHFTNPCPLPGGADRMLQEIERCQDVFLDNVQLGKNIAQNQALKENVFMMVTCIELRIPLFLVGKPGSSKSLAKTIVADAMQGHSAHKELFREYKTAQMVSFQCSPLSVPEGIVGTFRQCANFQKDRDLNTFVSVVVLDEVGLAEDSPRMPLKTLHPLLEDGCEGDEKPEPYKKVSFIGISNWALDPAKMNRGILVQREVPELKELMQSAEGICSTDRKVLRRIKPIIKNMAESYLELFQEASKQLREFFGLRDFYSLLKMVYAFADKYNKKPSWKQLEHTILRNFGGMDGIDPVKVFTRKLQSVNICERPSDKDPDCSPAGLIQACLSGDGTDSESRYLLLLTENYGALNILQQKILTMHSAITIFGSSFPSDQEYTQVCRNINRIKVCMETGSTVVLLNLENLYESLYDALNQYYVEFGGERYVDLGLGSHRVKCRVHKQFRLIVVAEKQIVYAKFPIPLINRLEKHFLNISTMLNPQQLKLAQKLESWTKDFAKIQANYMTWGNKKSEFTVSDVFMGYHADMCAAVILHVVQEQNLDAEREDEKILKDAKKLLLWCATPDSVMRLSTTQLRYEEDFINQTYFVEQQHESLSDYLYQRLQKSEASVFAQITTHSKLITTVDLGDLSKVLRIPLDNMVLLTLQSFDTEQQFCRQIRSCLENNKVNDKSLLVVQSDCGDQNSSLVACARYCIQDELHQIDKTNVHVVFIIQLPRIAGGCFSGFQCGFWHSLHIDDLRPPEQNTLTVPDMHGKSVGMLIHKSIESDVAMEIEKEHVTEEMNYGLDEHKPADAEMEVDESDIHVDIISPLARSHHRLPVHNLIFSCIQSALAMVKDRKGQKPRETERVNILLQLLHQRNHMSSTELILGLSKHLDLLLQEKEKNSTNASNWLAAEAARAENINTAGTFRRAWMLCMETKVTPILAGIIAFIDTNSNLDCLSSSQSGSWRQQLWMEIINCPQATGMQYNTQLVSPGRNQEVTEIMVNHSGAENHIFIGDMPFSWLIFRLIEDTVKTTYLTSGEDLRGDADVIAKARDVILNTLMGRVLQPVLEQNVQEATQAYLRDFIHMVYPVQTQNEHQLVCESLYTGTRALVEGHFGDGLAVIVGYHVSYRSSASRLKNFTNLNRVWPECSKCMIEFQSNTPTFFLLTDEEMTLDVLGLHLLLEKLEPEKDILNREQGRQEWLKKVHLYRPVVERILDLCLPGNSPASVKCGARCCRGIEQARLSWAGVLVVKLFLEHVCSMVGRGKEQLSIKRVMPLWTMMKSGVDMKKIESLEKVEKFLRMCNKTATSQIFEISKDNNACKVCESPFEGPPVTLPCKDVICTKCWNEMKITNDFECSFCHKKIKDDFNPSSDRAKNQLYERYSDYKRRCNSFFVEVVSQLCFADGTPPEDKVIEKLMKYITRETKSKKVVTKEMSIFDDDIDPTPVLRSFLLQLVLRTSGQQVYQYLEEYVKQANQFFDVDNAQDPQFIELCLLIIQCIEDSYHQEVSKSEEPEIEAISMAVDLLRSSSFEINNHETLNVQDLYVLAQARFGLIVAAKYVQEIFVVKSRKTCSLVKVRRLIDVAAHLCQDSCTKWPCIFFIKQLCRCYGLESYEVVSNSTDPNMCRWMRMLNLERDEKTECSDNYIVCGQQYADFREIVTKCLLGEHLDCLVETIQGMQAHDWKKRTWLLLAVHREVTMSNVYTDEKRQSMPKAIEPVTEFLTRNPLFKGQELLVQALMENSIWRHFDKLNISQGDSLQDQSLACLLVHALITLLQLPGERTVLQPFKNLLVQPHTMMNAFLPTMPQDDLAEIKEALLQGRGQFNFEENPVLYRCPNGHPYVIGNCGNPAIVGVCRECGSQIGGQGYRLQAGNIKDTGEDRTQPGHILGRANTRVVVAQTERKLTPVACAILRLLTHVIMLLGANENRQAICGMIKPDIAVEDVHDFLLSHILLDISIIHKTTGYSKDDVILLIHSLLSTILNTHNQVEQLGPELCGLMSKDSRNRWEEMFTARYIAPLLQTMDHDLKANNNLVASDKRLGSDPLLCLLYETETPQEASTRLHDVPAVWRYRKRISMDHLTTEFHNQMKDDYKVLQLFLKEEQQLRALRLVPSIMRLQKLLIQKYQLKLDKAEANTYWSLSDVISDFEKDGKAEEVKQLIADFGEAWDCVRESLCNFPCPTMDGYATVSKEYCSRQITIDTNISMILPTQRDVGLCSYVLLYYLLKKQNSFLDKYCKASKQSTNDLPKVKVADVTPAHLISYHPDRDILSIVLANCNYSFEVGHGTTITYDFQNIERQLMDRFFFSKSFIEIDEIEVVTYRSDATNSAVFFSLRAKIAQEQLGAAVRRQICEEFRSSLPDICYTLDNLDITISFLKSVGETPDCSLEMFMTNTLKLRNPLISQKSRQMCQCKHTQSLWITLALEKTKCLAIHKRDAFENIKPEFRIEMTEVQIEALNYFCDGLQIDKLDMLIECLFECVMLRLTLSQNQEDEDYVDIQKMSLRDFLMAHMESPLYDEDITFPGWIMEALGRLPADSESRNYLQVRHAVDVWLCLYESYRRKENERRR